MIPEKLAYIDVETTGMSFRKDRIIEIGIIRTENGEIVNTFNSLVNPQQRVHQQILEMTGISQNDLEDAPTFNDLYQEIGEILGDAIFVAHNAAFDYGFVKNEFKLLDKNYSAKCLCTVKLSRALFPRFKSHNLDSLINRFNLDCNNRHRAFDDAKVMVDFVNLVKEQFPIRKVEEAIDKILKKPSIPMGISKKIVDNLPETAGVYIFYGETGLPLYIGKSVNIKNRVQSHFSSASLSTTELNIATQVKDIQTIVTEGELGALLKESELIKKLMPVYNKKLRNASKLVYLGYSINKQGYKEAKISYSQPDEILGIFKTKKQLKDTLIQISEENGLCNKLLGLENTHSSCFGYQLGKCKGACVNEENAIKFNLRFDLAFIKTKIRSWPFNGPIIVSEGNEKFLVNNWRYKRLQENDEETSVSNNDTFDLDSYKILSNYINANKNSRNIVVVSRRIN